MQRVVGSWRDFRMVAYALPTYPHSFAGRALVADALCGEVIPHLLAEGGGDTVTCFTAREMPECVRVQIPEEVMKSPAGVVIAVRELPIDMVYLVAAELQAEQFIRVMGTATVDGEATDVMAIWDRQSGFTARGRTASGALCTLSEDLIEDIRPASMQHRGTSGNFLH